MADGPDLERPLRLLLLEERAGSLDAIAKGWHAAVATAMPVSGAQGLADLVSRDRFETVACELAGDGRAGLDILEQLRRAHPLLPLVAILPEESFSLAVDAFRAGADDLLARPLDGEKLRGSWVRVSRIRDRAARQARLEQQARHSLGELVLLKAVGETARNAGELDRLLEQVVELIGATLDAEIVSVMIADDDGVLRVRSARGLPREVWQSVANAPGEGVSGHVMAHGEPVLIEDLSTDGRFAPRDGWGHYRGGSLLSVPIRCRERIAGVLNVTNKKSGVAFSGADLELLATIAQHAGLAMENLKLVGSLHDKSVEAERARGELARLIQDRTRFVCNLSHELKTPLTAVLGYADLLLNFFEQLDPPRMREYIAGILEGGERLNRLLSGMLRLFSIDSGNEDWSWEELSLAEAVDRALSRHAERIAELRLDLVASIPADLLKVRGDREKLDLLLAELIDNAVKFNRPGGLLALTAGELTMHGRPAIYLQIANHGQSVHGALAEDIFQEYVQLGELDNGKLRGVGIGLATCRAILHQMKGDIFLEPTEGEGTSIGLLLPAGDNLMESTNG